MGEMSSGDGHAGHVAGGKRGEGPREEASPSIVGVLSLDTSLVCCVSLHLRKKC